MKRSHKIQLVLLGASVGALTACAPSVVNYPKLNPGSVLDNNYRLDGVGYYHAPFRAFYPQPYNYFDPVKKQYFFGGQWDPQPYQSIVNVSAPTVEAIRAAELAMATVIQRSGFGSTSGSHYIHS